MGRPRPTPGNADGYENKGVAERATQKSMKKKQMRRRG